MWGDLNEAEGAGPQAAGEHAAKVPLRPRLSKAPRYPGIIVSDLAAGATRQMTPTSVLLDSNCFVLLLVRMRGLEPPLPCEN
jgi:hypothetical protein